jgi:hypothetical protein
MAKNKPTYELNSDQDLSKFLLGAIRDVRKNELEVEKAIVISQLADKYTKNEIMRCIKAKMTKNVDALDFTAEVNKQLMQNTGDDDFDTSVNISGLVKQPRR